MTELATFAGGCFWCMQPPYDKVDGVQSVITGYIGGTTTNPTYENFAQHDHKEAVQISFDPDRTSYDNLLEIFWQNIDPTDVGGQFADRGKQYETAIFYQKHQKKTLNNPVNFHNPLQHKFFLLKNFTQRKNIIKNFIRKTQNSMLRINIILAESHF